MKKSFRNTAFMVELLINILVFSISCAILVGVFGKASQLARDTREENYAAAEIHSMFEMAQAVGTAAVTAEGVQMGHEVHYYYDKNWYPTSLESAEYRVTLLLDEEDTGAGYLSTLAGIAEHRSGREICTMETVLYVPHE